MQLHERVTTKTAKRKRVGRGPGRGKRERTAEGDRMEQNPDLAINKNGVMRVGKILLTEDCQNSGSPVLIKKFTS
ncbi:MAG: hypothetical protein CM1200mP30_05960 [Pseudomonadota bacterium]|nr:MAG: hypothetical protein CM1200mP30_05960 [Pseudomonadota bacterium]